MESQVVRKLRIEKGLTVAEAAALTGVSRSRLSRIENGEGRLDPVEIKRVVERLANRPNAPLSAMAVSKLRKRAKTADEYAADLERLMLESPGEKEAIYKLRRRLSWAKCMEAKQS